MKKALAFFTLLLGCVAMFAQSGPAFPYQAVVRNSQNQLIKDSTFAIGVEVYQGADLKFSETQSVTTNANGQLTMNIGGGAVVSGAMNNVTDWSVAKFKLTYHLSEGDIVSENAVNPVPYALQAANAVGGNFLTSDSAVITTMQGNITTNTTTIATNADDIAALANRVNTFNTNVCDSVATCVGNAIDARGFLTSDSAVITTMQGEIAALQAASLDCNDVKNCIADTLNAYTPTTQLCDAVKDCDFSGNTSIANLLQTLSDQIAAQNRVVDSLAHIVDSLSNITPSSPGGGDNTCCSELGARLDSLAHLVDSLSNLPHGGGDTPATFTCGTSKVKDVDDNEYNTVKIGDQCWMKENLRTNVGGSVYPKRGSETVAGEDTITYGRLYTWSAMMKGAPSTNYPAGTTEADTIVHGICPAGWHVPSNAEWDTLTKYVYNSAEPDYKCSGCTSTGWDQSTPCIANALSSSTGWQSPSECAAGHSSATLNKTGFSAVPAGACFGGDFNDFGDFACFWSATQGGGSIAWYRYLGSSASDVNSYDGNKGQGFSVRCLRDAGVGGGDEPSEPDTPDTPTDTFNCGTDKVKDVQNNEYNTVKIGNQCWTKENLRTNVGTGDYGYPTGVSGTADTVTYGRLYSWAAVMSGESASSDVPSGVRGICPEGWHVPSDGEWGNLINYVKSKPNEYKCGDDANNIANALSSETGWTNSSTSGCNAGDDSETRNKTGFSAVPAGYFGTNSTNKGTHTYFWSATDSGSAVYYRYLDNTSSSMNPGFEFSEEMGLSVRCLRN